MIKTVITHEDGQISIHQSTIKSTEQTFRPGFYTARNTMSGIDIHQSELNEVHPPFSTKENGVVIDTIQLFFQGEMGEKVKALGFNNKLGILLFGDAGTGKTSLINYIATSMVSGKDAIVFLCSCSNSLNTAMHLARKIREIQENPIILIADEFEEYAENQESTMKNFLDGNESVHNSLFLAATNYIHRIPDTLKKRSSRFKVVQEIKGITDKALMRDIYRSISQKIQPNLFTEQEIFDIAEATESATVDIIKHDCLDKLVNNFIPRESLNVFLMKDRAVKEAKKEEPKKEAMVVYGSVDAFFAAAHQRPEIHPVKYEEAYSSKLGEDEDDEEDNDD